MASNGSNGVMSACMMMTDWRQLVLLTSIDDIGNIDGIQIIQWCSVNNYGIRDRHWYWFDTKHSSCIRTAFSVCWCSVDPVVTSAWWRFDDGAIRAITIDDVTIRWRPVLIPSMKYSTMMWQCRWKWWSRRWWRWYSMFALGAFGGRYRALPNASLLKPLIVVGDDVRGSSCWWPFVVRMRGY